MEKRHAITESATRHFGSIGFNATTTLEITDEADVTEPLIYYYFKGKQDLFKISLDLAFKEHQDEWTGSDAVGSKFFIESVKAMLGFRARGRDVIESGEGYQLRESPHFL